MHVKRFLRDIFLAIGVELAVGALYKQLVGQKLDIMTQTILVFACMWLIDVVFESIKAGQLAVNLFDGEDYTEVDEQIDDLIYEGQLALPITSERSLREAEEDFFDQ